MAKLKNWMSFDAIVMLAVKVGDLWGPLLISLGITAFVCMGSYGDTEELFTNLFVVLWLGPLIISLNCRLLGARMYRRRYVDRSSSQ